MNIKLIVSLSLIAATAHAQPVPAPSPQAPTAPVPAEPVPANPAPVPVDPNAAPPVDPVPPAPPAEPPPAPPPPPPVVTTTTTPTPTPTPVAAVERKDDYYRRSGGAYGIFHKSRLSVGVAMGDAPQFMTDANGAEVDAGIGGSTMGVLAFEAAYLEVPSSYGNFHGIEFSTGLRSTPIDFWMSFGTAATFFNIGRGQPGSLRVGGSFGAGFNFAHGFGYVRGRAALVVIPRTLDAELSVQWTPPAASTQNYLERTERISVWYRYGRSRKAVEGYVERYKRQDDLQVNKREFDGYGVGIGWSLF